MPLVVLICDQVGSVFGISDRISDTGSSDPDLDAPGRGYTLFVVNIGMRAGYWRFMQAPGGADKAQR